ncbi:MAG: hypothetical protein GY730_10455 [bacterium]|nr:hypothetical protein [bacterium]
MTRILGEFQNNHLIIKRLEDEEPEGQKWEPLVYLPKRQSENHLSIDYMIC